MKTSVGGRSKARSRPGIAGLPSRVVEPSRQRPRNMRPAGGKTLARARRQHTMAQKLEPNIHAVVLGESPVRLWGLSGTQRLERQLRALGVRLWHDGSTPLPEGSSVIVLRGDLLYDARVLAGLVARPRVILEVLHAGRTMRAAAHVGADQLAAALRLLEGDGAPAQALEGVPTVSIEQIAQGTDLGLRKADRPYVLPVNQASQAMLEELSFAGAYKGITDLVTKWLWPPAAKAVTRLCVRLGITPNQVTSAGLVLVVVAGVLFARGEYGWGLIAGWIMTFLDTVDGKLARVTVTSTEWGNVFDHGIDLIHPPLWYLAWGVGLAAHPAAIAGVPLFILIAAIFAGYIGGRLCEGAFQLWVARFSIFTWRPFDSYFRLIVARRNPSLIMLTLGLLAGRPDLGLLAVAAWTVLSSIVLLLRLLGGVLARAAGRPAVSWLTEIGHAVNERSLAVRLFTRYAPADV